MKIKPTLKKVLATVLVVTMFASFGTILASAETTQTITITGESFNAPVTFSNGKTDLDGLKNALNNGFKNYEDSVDVSAYNLPYSDEGIGALQNIMSGGLPECFHIGISYNINMRGNVISAIIPQYVYTQQEYTKMYNEMITEANKLLRGIKNNNSLGDVEKALLLHDRLAVECEYDYANYLNNKVPTISHTMYGAVVNDVAVCQGYALAYGFLLDAVGIKNEYCSSMALGHAWNIVYINGNPYHVDVTWDDPVWDISGRVHHDNFLRSTDGIKATKHNANDFISTPSDTTYDEYFWQESTAAFVIIDNTVYYEDDDRHIRRYSDKESIYDSTARWAAGPNSYWSGDFTRLAVDGNRILFSTNDAIYRLDLTTGRSKRIYKPVLSSYFSVYGFKLDEGYLVVDLSTSPNFDADTKKLYEIKVPYDASEPAYTPGNINDDDAVDLGDVVVLSQYFAGWEVACNTQALDVNADGTTNLNDVVHLAQYVAGWDVTLY